MMHTPSLCFQAANQASAALGLDGQGSLIGVLKFERVSKKSLFILVPHQSNPNLLGLFLVALVLRQRSAIQSPGS